MLAEHFAINMARDLEWELFSGFTRTAQQQLLDYAWPGNIRELKNVVERSVYRSANPHVPVHDIVLDPFESPFRPKRRVKTHDRKSTEEAKVAESASHTAENPASVAAVASFPCDLKALSNEYEIKLINDALKFSQYNQRRTADALGLTYHQLRGYLKKYNLLETNSKESEAS